MHHLSKGLGAAMEEYHQTAHQYTGVEPEKRSVNPIKRKVRPRTNGKSTRPSRESKRKNRKVKPKQGKVIESRPERVDARNRTTGKSNGVGEVNPSKTRVTSKWRVKPNTWKVNPYSDNERRVDPKPTRGSSRKQTEIQAKQVKSVDNRHDMLRLRRATRSITNNTKCDGHSNEHQHHITRSYQHHITRSYRDFRPDASGKSIKATGPTAVGTRQNTQL